MKDNMLNILGLAARARKIVLGQEFVLKGMAKQQCIVFLASDAGENITKKIFDKAQTYNCTVFHNYTTDEISQAIGKTNRKVVLIEDKGFITSIKKQVNS